MFCTHCGTFNPPDTALCGGCAARLHWPRQDHSRRHGPGRRSWFLVLPFALAMGVITLVGWRTWEVRQEQSAAYDQAVEALTTGNLPAAVAHFGEAGGYRDAQEQRVTTQQLLAPYQAALLDAQSALDRGENQRAVELLRSVTAAMPDNTGAAELLADAEARFRIDLEREITVATTNRDWLTVERAMLALSVVSGEAPAEPALTNLRLAHAPLLFARDGALYTVGPDGGDEELLLDDVPVSAPLWSPDRRQIAFFSAIPGSERFAALFVVDADGANLRLVDVSAIISLPAWSADGRQLAFVSPASDDPTDHRTTLRIYALDSSTARLLPLPEGMNGVTSPSWSSDGTRLAVIGIDPRGENQILIVDVGSLEAVPLLESTPANARAVSWSPGADVLLLWTTTGDSDWYAIRGSMVYLVSIENRTVLPVTTLTQAPSRPVWSPDGVQFAYLERGATLHIRVRTGIGERTIELPNKGSGVISWGPGGVGIAVPPLDLAEPSMIVPVGDRLGPVRLLALHFEDGWPATDLIWASHTAPDPALFDPFPSRAEDVPAE